MLLVQDEHDLQGTSQLGVGLVCRAAIRVQHVQEVLCEAHALVGLSCCATCCLVIGHGSKSGDLQGSTTTSGVTLLTSDTRCD